QRAEPEGADNFRRMWNVNIWLWNRGTDGFKVAPCLFQEGPMNRIGDRTQQRCYAALVIRNVEVCCRDDGRLVTPRLKKVNEDADEVASFLRLGRDEHLIFEQVRQHGRIRPGLDKLGLFGFVLRGRDLGDRKSTRLNSSH